MFKSSIKNVDVNRMFFERGGLNVKGLRNILAACRG
jgi:hypothetical protein